MTIRLPRHIAPYPDRDLDCQQALEDIFRHVLSLAQRSGWSATEAAEALRELSFNHLAMEDANTSLEAALSGVGKTRH